MEFQEELLSLLAGHGLAREDIFSVMLVLTKKEKADEMISFLKQNKSLSADAIREKAGKIAFGENA